jgi:hypothetical protein
MGFPVNPLPAARDLSTANSAMATPSQAHCGLRKQMRQSLIGCTLLRRQVPTEKSWPAH